MFLGVAKSGYFVYNSFQCNYEEYKSVTCFEMTEEWSIIMTSKQRTELKAQAMKLDSIFQIGKSSLTPQSIEAIRAALKARELIKINVLKTVMMIQTNLQI